MKGLLLDNGVLQFCSDLPVPDVSHGEVLVRVLRAGICNTDLELCNGYYPFEGVLGHEFVGVVERGPQAWVGHRVVGEINVPCGACAVCSAGRRLHCPERTVLGIVGRDGAFAEYVVMPQQNLHRVPSCISMDEATFVEPLAAALQIQEQVRVGCDQRVLVVGDGKLGQLVAQTLARTGCKLGVVGRHAHKLALLNERGISTCFEEGVAPGCHDLVVECTGHSGGFGLARRALRSGGTLVMKSTYAGMLEVDASALVVDEITLVGSRCGPFAPALEVLASGEVYVRPLILDRFGIERGIDAFARAAERGVMKVLLDVCEE